MQVTIQTKITEEKVHEFLEDTAGYIGHLRANLLKALLSGEKIRDLKKQYIEKYGLVARQFNSLSCEVKGLIKSVKKLHQNNINNAKQRQKSLQKTIKKLTKKLKKAEPAHREGKKSAKEELRFLIHHKKRKDKKLEARIARLEAKKNSICLGSKKLFKAQFNLKENGYQTHEQWLEEFRKARTNRTFYIGSKDESFGNQNCQLLINKLQVRVLPALEEKYGTLVDIPINFSYGDQLIANALKANQAINYRFVRKDKGWYLFLTTQRKAARKVTKRFLGAIGVDFNKDHLAWGEINRHGNLIEFGNIHTPVQDRRNEQVRATLADAVKMITEYAKKQEKPIVIEELDFSKKKNTFEEKSVGYRRMLSSFAYAQFRDLFLSRTSREGVELIEKPAAFSSVIGKYKFSSMYGISVHIAASLVLARRGLRFSERLPAKNALGLAEHRHRHVWSLWRSFVNAVSNRDKRVESCNSRRVSSRGLSHPR